MCLCPGEQFCGLHLQAVAHLGGKFCHVFVGCYFFNFLKMNSFVLFIPGTLFIFNDPRCCDLQAFWLITDDYTCILIELLKACYTFVG